MIEEIKETPIERITIVLDFYLERGANKESVNRVYRKIISK